MSDSNRTAKERLAKTLREDEPQFCWVNPAKPEQSVLSREYNLSIIGIAIPLVFVVVGVLLAGFALRARWKKPSSVTGNQPFFRAAASPHAASFSSRQVAGGVELKSSLAPSVIGLLVFNVIWNGVVAVMWIVGGKFGKDMCFTLFRVVFTLLGLAVFYGLIRTIMQAMVPKPLLKVSSDQIALGESLEINWNYTRPVDGIERMTLTLVGREEATYRRGTTTSTDKSEFARITITDQMMRAQIASGRAKIVIPLEAMPSFTASNNKIVWVLELQQKVRKWPDVKREFSLTINPAEVS